MDWINVIVAPVAPLTRSTNLILPSAHPLSTLPSTILSSLFPQSKNISPSSSLVLHHNSRILPHTSSLGTLSTLQTCPSQPIFITPTFRLHGGKGGFGSQLRAQGGRMASRKNRGPQDKSACRDLN